MFNSLLESKATRPSRLGGSLASAAAHAVLIAGIIMLTAKAGVAREVVEEHALTYTKIDPPPPPPPPDAAPPLRVFTQSVMKGFSKLIPFVDIPDVIPRVDLNAAIAQEPAWTSVGTPGGSPNGRPSGAITAPGAVGNIFTRETVDRFVVMLPGSYGPAYPEMLRTTGVEGAVLAQFVVDTTGRADAATLVILQSDHALFSVAVTASMSRLRFVPAEVRGSKVRQLVQQPFRFGLDRN